MECVQKLSLMLALLCAYAPSLSAGKLHTLVRKEDSKQVEEFLKNNKNNEINAPNNNGSTPLHIACVYEILPVVKLLLKYNANPNIPDSNRKTPLHIACLVENIDIIKLLIENGADATLTSNNGESPLSTICTWSIKERKKLLNTLIPTANNLPQNTKTFIERVISTLADQIQQSSTIAPKVPQNDGLFRSPVVENPGQKIACIEEFTKILFEPRKKQYTWLDEDTNLNKFKIICHHDFQYSPSTCSIKINFGINKNQYAFLRTLQKMAQSAIVYNSNKTSSKAKQYSKLCDIIIKCHKPSSTESSVRFEVVTKEYGN
ncbi:MAG: Ankyrin repeat-containing protein [candidate division TM6 bacterium GW2011_GWE2_42_60]|nr:MAG: Ankyrin repeat-containing protein [candidate division TM6 bacterium GW2011_GWE2_42_60]HBY06071.1 hypothetical protein [Candidatus Dependentiae bacterium]